MTLDGAHNDDVIVPASRAPIVSNNLADATTSGDVAYDLTSAADSGPALAFTHSNHMAQAADTSGHVASNVSSTNAATTTTLHVAMVTDMQLHFIVVGCLFLVVVILALINLYIHFRSGNRPLIGVKIVGTEPVQRRSGYTVKMTAKPNLFI